MDREAGEGPDGIESFWDVGGVRFVHLSRQLRVNRDQQVIKQERGRIPPKDDHPLEIPQGYQSSSLAVNGRGCIVELDFAEAGSTLEEVEKMPDR